MTAAHTSHERLERGLRNGRLPINGLTKNALILGAAMENGGASVNPFMV